MKRPLSLAIALALTVAAGCNAPDSRTVITEPKPAEELASTAGGRETERRQNSLDGLVAVRADQPLMADARERDDAKAEVSILGKQANDSGAVAQEPVEAAVMLPPPAPPVSGAPVSVAPVGAAQRMPPSPIASPSTPVTAEPSNRENYADLEANPIQRVAEQPVSTFSIDVDSGSYANVRRMLVAGNLPPSDAVRAEEMINYFDYGYAPPASSDVPFSVTTELAAAPWNSNHQLLLVGIKGYEVPREKIPASNLVFLIDTSGSMQSPDKIDLLKQAFAQMVETLRPQDRVSIVTYAGSAGLVLPSTSGKDKAAILTALAQLDAGGSTNGGAGIELAYATAQQHYIDGGVNRVILATDGDFNVGTVDIDALKTLVEAKRESGVALTTLGFGTDNYNDELSEQLADIGNGNHAYIDTLAEGRKVMVDEISSTMMTIAKDVKIQMEFNPAVVAEYRLIGYENRQLRREDFNNDRIDAGEIGAGHDVTALYEIALVGSGGESVDPLRYAASEGRPSIRQDERTSETARGFNPVRGDVSTGSTQGGLRPSNRSSQLSNSSELGFLRLRYKAPTGSVSKLIEQPIAFASMRKVPSERLAFAASVAAFADSLNGSSHLGSWTLDDVAMLAQGARGKDFHGYRGEFVALVAQARALKSAATPVAIAH